MGRKTFKMLPKTSDYLFSTKKSEINLPLFWPPSLSKYIIKFPTVSDVLLPTCKLTSCFLTLDSYFLIINLCHTFLNTRFPRMMLTNYWTITLLWWNDTYSNTHCTSPQGYTCQCVHDYNQLTQLDRVIALLSCCTAPRTVHSSPSYVSHVTDYNFLMLLCNQVGDGNYWNLWEHCQQVIQVFVSVFLWAELYMTRLCGLHEITQPYSSRYYS